MIGRRTLLRAAPVLSILPVAFSRADARAEEIVLALAGPMSGEGAYTGQAMREAAEIACDFINGRGGVAGRRLSFSAEDDADNPAQAVSVANRIAAKRIPIVIGHPMGAAALAASPVYSENEIFLMAPVSPDAFTQSGSPFLLRLVPPTHCFADRLFDEIVARGASRVAIIHNKVEYGRGFAEIMRGKLRAAGREEPLFEGVNNGDKDFYSLVDKLKEWRPDFVILALYAVEAGLILRQATERGVKGVRFAGHAMLVTPAFTATAGSAANGVLVVSTRGCDPTVLQRELQGQAMAPEILGAFRRRGVDPFGATGHLIFFSAFQIAAEALKAAGSAKPDAISAVLHGHRFQTILGECSFTARGELADADRSLSLYEMGEKGPRLLKDYGSGRM